MTVKKGFTLIEIIVSLIIVGVVAIIAIPNVINSMEGKQVRLKIIY